MLNNGLIGNYNRIAIAEEFAHSHDVEKFSEAELDLWIKRLRPVRLKIRAINRELAALAAEVNKDISI
ncbi:hypothetical protein ACFLZW_02525 [Chloroflexota bacterium]